MIKFFCSFLRSINLATALNASYLKKGVPPQKPKQQATEGPNEGWELGEGTEGGKKTGQKYQFYILEFMIKLVLCWEIFI